MKWTSIGGFLNGVVGGEVRRHRAVGPVQFNGRTRQRLGAEVGHGALGAWAGILAPVSPKTCQAVLRADEDLAVGHGGYSELDRRNAARAAVPQFVLSDKAL